MTDSEKLDFLINAVTGVTKKITNVEDEVGSIKDEVENLKDEVGSIKNEVGSLKKSVSDVEKKVTGIEFLKSENEKELLIIKMHILEDELRKVRERLEEIA